MKLLSIIGDAIWAKLEPLLTKRMDELQVVAKTELDEWQVIAQQQLDEWRHDAMKMLKEALPEMAAKVSEEAVKTVFENTHIDEAANSVSDAFIGILDRLPKF